MSYFYINPLSANNQCHTLTDAFRVVGNLVDCFKYLHPAIQKERIRLIYEPSIEQRQLVANQHLSASINMLPKNPGNGVEDVTRLWFIYTKNRPTQISLAEAKSVTVSSSKVASTISGSVSGELFSPDVNWLSFGGDDLTEATDLLITDLAQQTVDVRNAHHITSLKRLLPRYEPSDKHKKVAYVAQNGEHVSAMPLAEDEAQRLLLLSIQVGSDRLAYHEARRQYYRYKLTRLDQCQCIYHGFVVEEAEVPEHLKIILHPQ